MKILHHLFLLDLLPGQYQLPFFSLVETFIFGIIFPNSTSTEFFYHGLKFVFNKVVLPFLTALHMVADTAKHLTLEVIRIHMEWEDKCW